MSQKKFNLPPPLKGFVELAAYAQQPAGTSPALHNVTLLDPSEERFRLAQRAGTGMFDLFDFATGTPIGTTTDGTRTLTEVTIPAGGVSTSDAGAIIINLPSHGCFAVTTTGPGVEVATSGTGCGPSTVIIGGQPNNSGSDQSGQIIITPVNVTIGDPTTVIPWTQPPTDPGDPGDPIPDEEKPYLKVVKCSDASVVGWVHQNVLGVFNALPVIYVDGVCCTVTGQRTTDELATPKVVADEVYRTCTECTNHHTWVQLHACDGPVDGSLVDAYLLKSSYITAGGGTYYFKASDATCYFTSGSPEVTVEPDTVLTIYLPKEDCSGCYDKRWFHIYSLTFDCATSTIGPVTYLRSECLDPDAVADSQWAIVDISGGQGVYQYYDPAGVCHDGDTAPAPGSAPAAPDPSFFDPASECVACTACGLMCLSEGTELDNLGWDISGVCLLANCSDFAGVLQASGLPTMIWDGTFTTNDIGDQLPAFGPFAVDLGNGWTGTARFECPTDGGVPGGLIVFLSKGPASITLEFRNYNDPPDDGDYTPSLGNLPLYLSTIYFATTTIHCPSSTTCADVTDAPITGSVLLINVCCQTGGECSNGTPQAGEGLTPMGICES